jgi:hypothetical protein
LMTSVIEEMTVDGLQSLIMLVCTSPPFIWLSLAPNPAARCNCNTF